MQDAQHDQDIATLNRLNADYIHSDQFNDVARYQQMLAPDFLVQLPDLMVRDRTEFLELIARPRPFTGLTAHDVRVRVTYTTLADGVDREALYTDTYQRRDGVWTCVAASVIAQGE